MTRNSKRFIVTVCLASTVLIGACAPDGDDTYGSVAKVDEEGRQVITGIVKEWEVNVDAQKAKAGEVSFSITNAGTIAHEFLVVKTDVPVGAIPVEGDRFSEEDEALLMIDEIPEHEAGTSNDLTVTLEPGRYQLVCNIAGHYSAGMHTQLVVEA